VARAKEGPRVRNDGEEAVPEIRVREKKGCDDGTRELNEHDLEVRITSARPGSLTTCLGSNSEQVGDLLFRKLIAPRRVTRVCVTCSRIAVCPRTGHGPRERLRERVHHAQDAKQ
jgi:hypothetical protein